MNDSSDEKHSPESPSAEDGQPENPEVGASSVDPDAVEPDAVEPDATEGETETAGASSLDPDAIEPNAADSSHAPTAASPMPRPRQSSFSTNRPVAVLMVFLATVVFGFFSYNRLPVTLMPELSYPTLTVRTEYPGAAPEEVENDISRPIEDALGVVGGLSKISSISRAGVSDVVLEFGWDVGMSDALQDTLEKLDLVFLPNEAERPLILRFDPSLDPVMELSLSGKGDLYDGEDGLRRLRRIAELQVKRALEPVKGVAAVRLRGGLEEEIHVSIDEKQMRRTGISIAQVINRLRQENVNVAGGTIKEGRTEYMVRTLNEFENLAQMRDVVVSNVDGRDVRLKDLATVVVSHKEREIMTRSDGSESVQIDIYKEADANMVAMADRVRASLGQFDLEQWQEQQAAERDGTDAEDGEEAAGRRGRGGREGFGPPRPSGLTQALFEAEGALLEVVADRSVFIRSSIEEVRNTAILGGILAVIVLFVFLRNARSTAIIAVSIPISLLVTFAPLDLFGVSLNIMSLGGLALGIGMLVDSSIVVLESIFRCREEGDDLVTAAVRGTQEVRGAVVASTLTSIAVFFPMIFVEGVAGQAFGDLGMAVVISLLASVVVAIFFIPMLASRQGLTEGSQRRSRHAWYAWPQAKSDFASLLAWTRQSVLRWLVFPLAALYLGLRSVLHGLFEVLAFVLGSIARWGGRMLYLLARGIGWLLGKLVTPLLYVVGKFLDGVQGAYPKVLGWTLRNGVTVILASVLLFVAVGWLGQSLESELLPEVHQGELTVEVALPVGTPLEETNAVLAPVERAILAEEDEIEKLLVTIGYDAGNSQRSDEGEHTARFKVVLPSSDPRLEERVIARLRERFEAIPDLEARVVRPVLFSFKTPIEIEIQGDDLETLETWASRSRNALAELGELADVETTLRPGAPEMQIVYDRDMLARYDLDIANVAELVRNSVQGFEATRFNMEDRRIPIVVRFAEDDRATVSDVSRIEINPGSARPIPLEAVAAVELGEGPSEVRRIDGRRVALVRSNLGDGTLGAAVEAIESTLSELPWPAEMSYFLTGQNQEWERSRGSLMLALALSIFLVYVIMAAQFESLFHPFVIMFTIPLAFLGTFLGLHALGISLSIVVFLGMIMLAGIVVNNAIVLVDYANQLQARGLDRAEAVITAGSVRLRPILMTTATTVLGLLPMAVGLGDGAEIRRPMAIAVICGLAVSTVLTLLVIPNFYYLIDRLQAALFGRKRAQEESAVESASEPAGQGVTDGTPAPQPT